MCGGACRESIVEVLQPEVSLDCDVSSGCTKGRPRANWASGFSAHVRLTTARVSRFDKVCPTEVVYLFGDSNSLQFRVHRW